MQHNEASLRQIEAADPTANTWLSANAGSGKTRVLTDRVARLLLSGVNPQHILCLTYTKAAASEMQNRLFKRLGEWSMQEDQPLRDNLTELGIDAQQDLANARRLFARAIETPGGLRIQTIHSFCASVLRRFPLEAGVSVQFREMDEAKSSALISIVLDKIAEGPDHHLFDTIAGKMRGDPHSFAKEILGFKRDLQDAPDNYNDWFNLPDNFTAADLLDETIAPGDAALLAELTPLLHLGNSRDQSAAKKLERLPAGPIGLAELPLLETVFLNATGKNIGEPKFTTLPGKDLKAGPAQHLIKPLYQLMTRVADAAPKRKALKAAQETADIHRFAKILLNTFETEKAARGWLDFDDLIEKTEQLLSNERVASWVLFKLDGGIDHILVDEAQDTNPLQWQVIASLAREFSTAGSARSSIERTIFVVGDQKQSIYSFQGADPKEFTRMQEVFNQNLSSVGRSVKGLTLEYSFRSAPTILKLVDQTLQNLPGLEADFKHRAFATDRPGRVDLWPKIAPPETPEPSPWFHPIDMPSPRSAPVLLGEQIAEQIAEMLKTGSIPGKNGFRRIEPRDILILVRRRKDLFNAIISACKSAGLPIAGADKLKVGEGLAVRDVLALLRFLATPEDDLSLAVALRSPIFGLSENDLFNLAHGRSGYLWTRLKEQEAKFPETLEILHDLRKNADFLRPYELIDRLLTRHDCRSRLIGRLGSEAEDTLDALLNLAMSYEMDEVPSLTGFLIWMSGGDTEIKRQMDEASNQIRVMTAHGAKGLEAPIVILPETEGLSGKNSKVLIDLGDGRITRRLPQSNAPEQIIDAQQREKISAQEEYNRLLYVSMTRAEHWLIIAGIGEKEVADSWYGLVQSGMQRAGGIKHMFGPGEGLRLQEGHWEAAKARVEGNAEQTELPKWIQTKPDPDQKAKKTISPSDLGGAKALPGEGRDTEMALRHGTQVHLLLEHLSNIPDKQRRDAARRLLGDLPEFENVFSEAQNILKHAPFRWIFSADSLKEAPIATHSPIGTIFGTIDRLVIRDTEIIAIDFKTNSVVPQTTDQVPEGILRQMGAYDHALQTTFPNHSIRTAILWTTNATLMELPPTLVHEAFRRLDDQRSDS